MNATNNENTTIPTDEMSMARACADIMWADDPASQRLGMQIERIAPGEATITMPITDAMVNGHGTCHGGYIFALADSAFAFACNTRNQRCVGQHCSITYLAPAFENDCLRATAREVDRRGRSGLYDVCLTNQRGERIAEFRGHARTVRGTFLPEQAE